MGILAVVDVWDYELHPEVWLLLAAIVALGVFAVRSIGPLVVADGEPVVTRRQTLFFAAGVATLGAAALWPVHDIAEEYLYSVHMVQHLLISFVVPPLLLVAMPEWLARLLVLDGSRSARILRRLTTPVVAGVVFNVVQALYHWEAVVNLSVENGAFHYGMHLLVFFTALIMWFPVLGPLREVHMSEPGKMIYLFLMSIVPTVPAAWLTFAEGAVYSSYDQPDRLWGISVANDQQMAGLVMKILGGFYLWTHIALRFFRFAGRHREDDLAARRLRRPAESPLTVADVETEFDRAGPPARETVPGER